MTRLSRPRTPAASAEALPLPGTPEARALGCRCPMAEDPGHREGGLVIYFGNCPVHRVVVDRLVRHRLGGPARKSA